MHKEYKLNKAYYVKESRKWLTALNELRTENIRLKNQLSEAISHEVGLDFVEEAERFQQRFVEKDQVIDLLRHDINILQHANEPMTQAEERQYIVLEKDMEQLINEFRQMQASFINFLRPGNTG